MVVYREGLNYWTSTSAVKIIFLYKNTCHRCISLHCFAVFATWQDGDQVINRVINFVFLLPQSCPVCFDAPARALTWSKAIGWLLLKCNCTNETVPFPLVSTSYLYFITLVVSFAANHIEQRIVTPAPRGMKDWNSSQAVWKEGSEFWKVFGTVGYPLLLYVTAYWSQYCREEVTCVECFFGGKKICRAM